MRIRRWYENLKGVCYRASSMRWRHRYQVKVNEFQVVELLSSQQLTTAVSVSFSKWQLTGG